VSRRQKPPKPDSKPFHNPFAALADQRGTLPTATEAVESPPTAPRRIPKAVIRFERKGRGGKEVTCVEQLDLAPPELERWLREFKHLLGCGGTLEGTVLVLQGDQRQRLKDALLARGVRKISVG